MFGSYFFTIKLWITSFFLSFFRTWFPETLVFGRHFFPITRPNYTHTSGHSSFFPRLLAPLPIRFLEDHFWQTVSGQAAFQRGSGALSEIGEQFIKRVHFESARPLCSPWTAAHLRTTDPASLTSTGRCLVHPAPLSSFSTDFKRMARIAAFLHLTAINPVQLRARFRWPSPRFAFSIALVSFCFNITRMSSSTSLHLCLCRCLLKCTTFALQPT